MKPFSKLFALRRHLLAKLLLINLLLLAFVISFIWFAVDYLAADYFSLLMAKYHISPDDAHNMFVLSVHDYLLAATLISIILVVVLNFFLTKRVVRPIAEMSQLISEMENGRYHGRVQTLSKDEIGQLANAFNHLVERLNLVEQLRHDMVEDISHELRTPLTNIRGYIEGLQEGVISPSAETLDILTNEVNRLINLVERLQRTARANASDGHLRYSMVDLKQLLQEIAILYRNPIDKKRLTLSFRLPDHLPPIQADRELLLQILCNLLDNACLYTPESGWIVLELLSRDKDMLFSLSNACEPISDSELSLLPERFYRSEKSRSRNLGGAGLGLAIVKKLIESQHGSLYLSSLANGLRVDFTLPKNPKIAIA